MRKGRNVLVVAGVLALSVVALVSTAMAAMGKADRSASPVAHAHTSASAQSSAAADLRVTLDRLLGEHTLLAIAATQRGYQGGREFPALAKALDRNSVQLADAIGSVFGRQARNEFLNGNFMWRAHIRFFVDYTVAKAKKDARGQRRAVNNLKTYIGTFSNFLAKATGLPQRPLAASITTHVTQLKGQLDAFAAGRYDRSYSLTRAAYAHMFMTGDTLAAGIARKFPEKFGA